MDGLRLARDVGIDYLIVELGALGVLDMVWCKSDTILLFSPLISERRRSAQGLQGLVVRHVHSGAADELARTAKDFPCESNGCLSFRGSRSPRVLGLFSPVVVCTDRSCPD